MGALDKFKLYYEDLPFEINKTINNNPVKQGGKAKKMASKSTKVEEAPRRKAYRPTRAEVVKDIIIAILVTAIIAFTAGMKVANNNHADMDKAIQEATTVVETAEETPAKK